MKTLISLERYVAQRQFPQTNLEAESESLLIHNFYNDVIDYATALKQQPQLNHFMPCVEKDGKWEVLEEPHKYKNWLNYDYSGTDIGFDDEKKCREYQSASKNVLFDGWEIAYNSFDCVVIRHEFCEITFREFNTSIPKISVTDFTFSNPIEKDNAIYSDLTKYNLPLTDNGEIYFNIKN